jgi:hypothetical protein
MSSLSYIFSEIRENYDDRLWWRNRLTERVIAPSHRRFGSSDGAVRVMDEDWDNLLVLDACRADLFETVADTGDFDEYRRVTSLGSMTEEWTERNFQAHEFGDTVYIACNPITSRVAADAFHDLQEVWRDSFDEERKAIMPEPIADAARDAYERYPDKRLLVHFLQPHIPFVDSPDLVFRDWWSPEGSFDEADADPPRNVWGAMAMGLVEYEEVWDAYERNLRLVLGEAMDLAADLPGKTVLTSDHGNMMGERTWPVPIRLYGHPRDLRAKPLVTVPWAVLEGERRDIIDDGIGSSPEAEEDEITDRLQALGYY